MLGHISESDKKHAQVVQICAGLQMAVLLTDEGIVYSWGSNNSYGQLGRATASPDAEKKPFPVFTGQDLKSVVVIQIACGNNHGLALTDEGGLYAWGRNKSGQLGNGGIVDQKLPKIVEPFKGKDATAHIKSIVCGPNSSAAITTKGEIYVWGESGYHFFQDIYHGAENCTKPKKMPNVPPPKHWKGNVPDRISMSGTSNVGKQRVVCTMTKVGLSDELADVLDSLKTRSTALLRLTRAAPDPGIHQNYDEDETLEPEELDQMKKEYQNDERNTKDQLEQCKRDLKMYANEAQRIGRDLTVCDQQDTALSEVAKDKETFKGENINSTQKRNLDTQLNDINHFKESNRKNKIQLLEQRDNVEQMLWKLNQDLTILSQKKVQVEARQKLLRALAKGTLGKGNNSFLDKGLRIAYSKHKELSATHPMRLSGDGNFTGVRDVLMTSDRALNDVSSALKEVSAAASGGDGAVLEEVLEANLKLRKHMNEVIYERVARAETGSSGAGARSGPSDAEGIIQFFKEASLMFPTGDKDSKSSS